MDNTEVKYTLILEGLDRLEKGMVSAKSHTNALDGAMGSLKGAVMGLVGAYASFEFLKESFNVFEENKVAVATLTQAYNNNSDSVNMNMEGLEKLAEEQENLNGILEKNTYAAEQSLMKFSDLKIGYEELIPISADLATSMGTDIASAAGILGKALEDPIKGMRMLGKEYFSPAQKEHIKNLTEQNKLFEAQTFMVDILKEKTGGLAKAAYEANISQQFKVGLDQVQKSIGELIDEGFVKLMPYIKQAMGWVKSFAESLKHVDFEGFISPIREIITDFKELFSGIGDLMEQLGMLQDKTSTLQTVFDWLGKAIHYSLIPFKAMLEYSIWFIDVIEKIIPRVVGFGYAVKEVFIGIGKLAKDIFAGIEKMMLGMITFDPKMFSSGLDQLKGAFVEYGKGVASAYNEGFEKYKIGANGAVSPAVTDAEKKVGENKSIKAGKGVGDLTPTSQADKVSGTKQVIINVTIGKLVDTVKVVAQNLKEGINQAAPDVAKALLSAVNQFSASTDI